MKAMRSWRRGGRNPGLMSMRSAPACSTRRASSWRGCGSSAIEGLGHHGVEDVKIVRRNDQVHASLPDESGPDQLPFGLQGLQGVGQSLVPDDPPGGMAHKRQVGPGDVVRPPKGGAQQLAGHQQIRYQVRRTSGPALGHQGQALLSLLHDPERTGHRLFQGRGHLVWVALGSGPGELEIGLDILGLQPIKRRGHQAHPGQEIVPGKSGVLLRSLAPVLQLDHFHKQGQAQGGAMGRSGAAAGIRPGLGQGLQKRRIHIPPLVKVAPGSPATANFPGPCYCGPKSQPGQLFFQAESQTWPGNRHGRADKIVRRGPGFKGSTLRPEVPNVNFLTEKEMGRLISDY